MAFETSTSLIRELQISFRKEAGVPSYDPDDQAIIDLPSLEKAIAEADPSPPYLRCKQCRGRLLRGLQSLVCVFCGAQQRREIPPDPIPFKSTVGYRWLLESLDLTGSEAVTGNVGTERLSASKDSLVLSDLFDFELRWCSEPEKNEDHVADKAQHSLNFTGVDLDDFFSESNKETSASVFVDQSIPNKQILSMETSAFPGQGGLSLFENAQTSDMAMRSVFNKDFIDESFSGWEAEFQSASSQKLEISSSLDDPSGSFMDIKFINSTDNDGKPKNDSIPPAPVANSWIQSDQRHSSSAVVSHDSEQFKINIEANNSREAKVDSNDLSSLNGNWVPDELWPTGTAKTSKVQKIDEDDDSFDTWQDFTSSADAPNLFAGSGKQSSSTTIFSDENTAMTKLVNSTNNLQEIELGGVLQPDLFSGPSSLHNGLADSSSNLDGSISYRVMDAKTEGIAALTVNSQHSDAATKSDSADAAVETLMAQMHDLSFMLETDLCLPKRTDGCDSIS